MIGISHSLNKSYLHFDRVDREERTRLLSAQRTSTGLKYRRAKLISEMA